MPGWVPAIWFKARVGRIGRVGVDQVDVVAFSQRDPRWADERLGTGELSIGQVGCLLSAAASMLASWGVATDPHRLNEFVLRSFGFVNDNLFVFASIDGLACRFVEFVDCETVAAPVAKLQTAISSGYGVLCCVDATPGGRLDRHWVWVYAAPQDGQDGQDRKSWLIVDPWRKPGHERIDLGAYLAAGWSPARGIFAAAIYERLTARSVLAWRSDVEVHQPAVCVREGAG